MIFCAMKFTNPSYVCNTSPVSRHLATNPTKQTWFKHVASTLILIHCFSCGFHFVNFFDKGKINPLSLVLICIACDLAPTKLPLQDTPANPLDRFCQIRLNYIKILSFLVHQISSSKNPTHVMLSASDRYPECRPINATSRNSSLTLET